MSGMTSMQRVLTSLGQQEPDRTPFFLLLTMHGARELGLSIQEYFARADAVVEGQLRMWERYRHDCLYAFFYAALEVEAFGGEVRYVADGPPVAGAPVLPRPEAIDTLQGPRLQNQPCLTKVLNAISRLKAQAKEEVPIIGVVMSPFSLPVMQMGFEPYLLLIHDAPERFWKLMDINMAFCAAWANAQLCAGATAICYFDPMSSPTILPRTQFLATGYKVACETLKQIQGPTAFHLASGRTRDVLHDLANTGTAVVGVSCDEDLADLKAQAGGKLTILGNLNGVAMRRWSPVEAQEQVRSALQAGGRGGGFILSDTHGEIPFQVPESTLSVISEAVHRWGSQIQS